MESENQVQALLAALGRLRDAVLPEDETFERLLELLFLALGERDHYARLESLGDRIRVLVERERLDETVLVMGLVACVTEALERAVIEHGDRIIFCEHNLQLIDSDPTVAATMRGRTPVTREVLDRLKNPDYMVRRIYELDAWNIIVAQTFSRARRMLWRSQHASRAAEALIRELDSASKEVRDILGDIPIGRLREKISFGDLKRLTAEQARKIRKELAQEG